VKVNAKLKVNAERKLNLILNLNWKLFGKKSGNIFNNLIILFHPDVCAMYYGNQMVSVWCSSCGPHKPIVDYPKFQIL